MWLKPQGYASVLSPNHTQANLDGFQCVSLNIGNNEYDTTTCNHCQRVTHVQPKMDPADLGGLCKICMKMICRFCVGHGCTPFEKKLELMEKRDRALRSYGF